jgi:hypothetical protein
MGKLNKNGISIILVFLMTIGMVAGTKANVEMNGNPLRKGDVHIDPWEGTFASNLDGNYTIVVKVDYDSRTMDAVIIDNITKKATCVPSECNHTLKPKG